jgi:hypothetical protein
MGRNPSAVKCLHLLTNAGMDQHESLGANAMNNFNLYIVAAVPLVCFVYFFVSRRLNKDASAERDSATTLIVLSGMLAALAILIPVAATFLPDKQFTWKAFLLIGALLTAVVCMFGLLYSMVKLQDQPKFTPNKPPYIPSWINATWFALSLLALSSVIVKSLPAMHAGDEAILPTQVRFVVARDLPTLGTARQVIETRWGAPALEKDSALLYRTSDGFIVFCIDSKGITQSITEAKETDANAVKSYCR